jgi:mRNA interferase HicA
MKGSDFIDKIKALGKARNVDVTFDKKQGKGSHGTLYYGKAKTTVKDRKKEIGVGLLLKMLADLGLTKKDLE